MCGADVYSVIYLCSCSCCSKLRVSLQKSWQLAGLFAKTLAFGAKERLGLMTVFRIITVVTMTTNRFIIGAAQQIPLQFNSIMISRSEVGVGVYL